MLVKTPSCPLATTSSSSSTPNRANSPVSLSSLCPSLFHLRPPLPLSLSFFCLYETNQTGKQSHSISLPPSVSLPRGTISLKLSLCQGSTQWVMFSFLISFLLLLLLFSLSPPSLSKQKSLSGVDVTWMCPQWMLLHRR